jgi:outer membrane protein
MKQTKQVVGGIFALMVTILLFVQCKEQTTKDAGIVSPNSDGESDTHYLPLAYVEVDSLLVHFEFYNRLASAYEDKVSKNNSSFNSSYQKLQNEVISFQQKMQNNAFLSQERAIQEQNRLQRMEDDLKKRYAQMEQELALEQQLIQQQLSDSLVLGLKEYNVPQKYHLIFAKSGNSILYADAHYNITNDVLGFLNKRFKVKE